MEVLANIEESELEGLLHDPEFLNMNPNLPPEVRRKLIEDIRFILCLIFVLVFLNIFILEKNVRNNVLLMYHHYLKLNYKKLVIH
jgi:hypothetical protein